MIRWLTAEEIESRVNPILRAQGWALLNINEAQPTCRVLGELNKYGSIDGFVVLQLFPILGPIWVTPERRDGKLSRELSDQMQKFLIEANARGALLIADSPVTERLAERHGWHRIESPVYIWQP